MSTLELPLGLVGWLFTLLSAAALAAGALIIVAMHRAGELHRRFLAASAWNDMALFAIWILGLAGGIGVLRGSRWGRDMLEFFCWTLIAQSAREPVHWVGEVAGITLVVFPLVVLCLAGIATLRSDAARQVLAG